MGLKETDVENKPDQTDLPDLITISAESTLPTTTSLATNANQNIDIPKYTLVKYIFSNKYKTFKLQFTYRFYFPSGKRNNEQWDPIEHKLTEFFQSLPNAQASEEHFDKISIVINIIY